MPVECECTNPVHGGKLWLCDTAKCRRNKNMKYYAIGDIHGRFDLLEKAYNKFVEVSEDGDKFITLGDYIDRGPDSRKVIEFLMELSKDKDIICLQGNHEEMAVWSIHTNAHPNWWMGNGGNTTLYSYGHPHLMPWDYTRANVLYSFIPEEHVKWMNSLPLYHETEKQVFVHAGIHSRTRPLAEQQFDTGSNGERRIQWMLYGPSDHGGWCGKHVVHGHHQFADGPHVWHAGSKGGGRTDLDVFAWKTGRLVIGVFDDTKLTALEFIEVKADEKN